MKPNPGGLLPSTEILGRDALIESIWQALDGQSVHLTAERRVGKTSILRKMRESAVPGRVILFLDVEGLSSPQELTERVVSALIPGLDVAARTRHRFFQVLEGLGGTQLRDLKLPHIEQHWKTLLSSLVADGANESRTLYLFLDEFPWFVDKVMREAGPRAAMETLDNLRALRQEHPALRMLLTGSIGIHHILDRLRKLGYGNQPLNDLRVIEVPPLVRADARILARELIAGSGLAVPAAEHGQVVEELAVVTGGFPFYIHHLVAAAVASGEPLVSGGAERLLRRLFRDAHDIAQFRHFRTRLAQYYDADAALVISILDDLARAEAPPGWRELLHLARGRGSDLPEDSFRTLLARLEEDHYLRRGDSGGYEFRYEVVKRWWRFDREL